VTRVLGVVGGTGPESTIDYYRAFVATWRRRRPDGSYPRLIINSVEAGAIFRSLSEGRYSDAAVPLRAAVEELAAAGAGAALLASNASHLAYDEVADGALIPLIHIVEVAVVAATSAGHRRLALFGTRMVMEASLYPERFRPVGIEIVLPNASERDFIHEAYFGELVQGVIRDETRERLVAIAAGMRERDGIDGLVLGGTELALILRDPTAGGVPVLNTAPIHVDAGDDWLLGGP
jgi:aspartate racemase